MRYYTWNYFNDGELKYQEAYKYPDEKVLGVFERFEDCKKFAIEDTKSKIRCLEITLAELKALKITDFNE